MNEDFTFFDVETDGLLDAVTRIHCIAIARGDEEVQLFHGSDIEKAIEILSAAPTVVAHNGIGYDCPVIQKLYKVNLVDKCHDTLVVSRVIDPERYEHSLDALTKECGSFKGDYTGGWEEYNDEMGNYCVQDVQGLREVYKWQQKQMEGHDWSLSLRIEHQVARLIAWQERNGWLFNEKEARRLVQEFDDKVIEIDTALAGLLEPKFVQRGSTPVKPYTAQGKLSARAIKWCEDNNFTEEVIGGTFSAVDLEYPNLQSRQQLVEILGQQGWKPSEYTEKGSPRLTEESLVGDLGEVGRALADRFVINKRKAAVVGLLREVRQDGRVPAKAIPNGTPTARMRHSVVVNMPRVTSMYGKELRSLLCVPEGKIQVGADASALELRMFAHYMGDPKYVDAVVNGKSEDETDVHSLNCKLLGMEPKKQYTIRGRLTSGRDLAKTFIYACLYGAGDEKLGSIVDGSATDGKRLRNNFMKGLPAYKKLIDRVTVASKKGWLKGIDGRKVPVRSSHAALNSLLQSAGSICVKVAMAKWAFDLRKQKIPFKLLGTFHDEIQAETLPEHADLVGKCFVDAMQWAGEYLKVTCPLSGEYKIGKNWSDCH